MRPRIVDFLESLFGAREIEYLVPTGTTLLALAIVVVFWIVLTRGTRTDLPPRHIVGASAAGVLCGLAGARLFHLVQHLPNTLENPEVLLDFSGGTTSWGGYLIGIAAFCVYLVVARQPVSAYLDVLASSLALGPAIARWGCFMNGCCFGRPSEVVWAIQFPRFSFAYDAHAETGLIEPTATLSHPVHPVQVYASLVGVLLFILMSRFWSTYRHRPGLTFAAYWMIYCAIRFGMEFLRGDVSRFSILQMTMSQHACLLVLVTAGIWFRSRWMKTRGLA